MVNTLDLTTLIIQIPEAQRMHHAQLIHPEMHQAMALELAQRKQRLKKSRYPNPGRPKPKQQSLLRKSNALIRHLLWSSGIISTKKRKSKPIRDV